MVAYLISDEGNISVVLKGKQYFVNSTDDVHAGVMDALREEKTEDEIFNVLDRVTAVQNYVDDTDVKIIDGVVTYQGEEVHNTLTERILKFMRNDLPVQPLVNFLKKLMGNPSYSARQQLFDFLSHKSLPVTEDGDFLAYKAVRHDYKDKWKGSLDNSVGHTVSMTRFHVDDDRNNGCSAGLHAGTLDYVQGYGSFREDEEGNPDESSDRCIIVKIDPTNVVSVPLDCECQKLRTCSYTVLKDYEGEMEYHLYSDDGDEWEDEDWDIDDYMDYEDFSSTPVAPENFVVDTSSLDSFKDNWMDN
tara:strand:- start:4587 stop:5495 length:909 start_codon:yes stop_codon:yes gene_type:complete